MCKPFLLTIDAELFNPYRVYYEMMNANFLSNKQTKYKITHIHTKKSMH